MRKAVMQGSGGVQISKTASFEAPTRGWIRNENLAHVKSGGATVLENWFPTTTGARVRKGSQLRATIGTGDPTTGFLTYNADGVEWFFAATADSIYDITTVADSAVSPVAVVTGLEGGDWSYVQFATSGGIFLVAVNGVDDRQLFDGAAWGTSPAITPAAGSFDPFSHVWAFKERLFFVEGGTMNAWYLEAASIGGDATLLPLGGVFTKGGSLLFGGTWSYQSAGTGMQEACIFVTTEGEVALYEGSDPASGTTWALSGVYQIGRPMGKHGHFKGGGDVAIATDLGLVPLSKALVTDQSVIAAAAVSYPIEEEWSLAIANRYNDQSWYLKACPSRQMIMVAMPGPASSTEQFCFVVNSRTGAWAKFTNWNPQCLETWDRRLFYGTTDGRVIECDVGGSDVGAIYYCNYVGLFSDLNFAPAIKDCVMGRGVFRTNTPTNARVSVSTDYVPALPTAPDVASFGRGDLWDVGLWNVARWSVPYFIEDDWQSTPGSGNSVAPNVQISIGGTPEPDIQLVRFDIQYESGDVSG